MRVVREGLSDAEQKGVRDQPLQILGEEQSRQVNDEHQDPEVEVCLVLQKQGGQQDGRSKRKSDRRGQNNNEEQT